MSSSSSGSSDRAQLLVLAGIILALGYVGLTLVAQDVANLGFQTAREEVRSLVREYDNAKDRFGDGLEHAANDGNHSTVEHYLIERAFENLTSNYTELEASRRTHFDADLGEVQTLSGRDVKANVTLTFRDEFTRVNEQTNVTFPLYLADEWWDTSWAFRLPVTLDARLLDRTNYGLELTLNLTEARERAGRPGSVDADSVRVVEVSESGTVLGEAPRGVQEMPGFDAAADARVYVAFNVTDETPERTKRYYHVYFDEDVPTQASDDVLRLNATFEDDDQDVDPHWTPGSEATDGTHAHTGERSWRAADGDTITHSLDDEFHGVVDGWFFDPDPSDTDVHTWMEVELNNTNGTDPVTFALGVDGSGNYSTDNNGTIRDASLPREPGWHRFTFVLNQSNIDLYVDQKRVLANLTGDPYRYQEVHLTHDSGTLDTWFDDVRVLEGVTVSRVHPMESVVRWPHWTR